MNARDAVSPQMLEALLAAVAQEVPSRPELMLEWDLRGEHLNVRSAHGLEAQLSAHELVSQPVEALRARLASITAKYGEGVPA